MRLVLSIGLEGPVPQSCLAELILHSVTCLFVLTNKDCLSAVEKLRLSLSVGLHNEMDITPYRALLYQWEESMYSSPCQVPEPVILRSDIWVKLLTEGQNSVV